MAVVSEAVTERLTVDKIHEWICQHVRRKLGERFRIQLVAQVEPFQRDSRDDKTALRFGLCYAPKKSYALLLHYHTNGAQVKHDLHAGAVCGAKTNDVGDAGKLSHLDPRRTLKRIAHLHLAVAVVEEQCFFFLIRTGTTIAPLFHVSIRSIFGIMNEFLHRDA